MTPQLGAVLLELFFEGRCTAAARQVLGIVLGAVMLAVPVYAGNKDHDYYCDYRVPAGFVYSEATITADKARELARKHAVLTLANVTELSVDIAEALVTPYEDTFLTLPAVTKLDERAAATLGKRRGNLRLWGLESLTPEVATALVSRAGQRIELDGVKEISPDVARALANGKRSSGMTLGLKELPPDVAAVLADFPYNLSFPRLESLSIESANAIRPHGELVHRGAEILSAKLDLGKATISPEVAEILLLHDGPLGFARTKRLEPGVGDILARHRFEVLLVLEEIDSVALARKIFSESHRSSSVFRLRTMSPAIAAEYARADPGYLAHLDTLSIEAAVELAKGAGSVNLPAITQLSPELAEALTNRESEVYLRGIKALAGPDAVAVAEALASTPAPVYMEFLERVSAPALAALRKKPTITLPPDDKLTIVP